MPVETDILPPRYRTPELIGHGGMGDIYRATDTTLGRDVAVKVLAERYARDDDIRRRFTREALASARLSGDQHTVTIFDVGEWNGRPFMVMEYVAGGSLEERLRARRVPRGQALAWLEQAAEAIDAAHRSGIVHRDVKPANLLLDRNGELRVADFGIASAAGLDSLTLTGTVLGTSGYLSPEQAAGQRAEPASDRYAFAVVAFELLTGSRPYEADSVTAEAAAHLNAPVPSVRERDPSLPRELDHVFERALAKDPAARYPTAAEFVADLRRILADDAGTTRRMVPAAAGRPRLGAPLLLLALMLVAAGIAGAVIAAAIGGGDGKHAASVRTITARGTTLRETVTARAPTTAPSASSGSALNDAGYAKMQSGDYLGALPLLEQAVQKLQGSGSITEAYASYNLAYTRLQLGRCDGVTELLDRSESIQGHRKEIDHARKQAKKECGE